MYDLEQRFQRLQDEYLSLKQKCESSVVNWKWAKSDRYDPRLFWFERNRSKSGRLLKSPPLRPNGNYEYGFDKDRNLIIERQHVSAEYPDKIWFYETFHTYQDNQVFSIHYHYSPSKEPIFISRSTYKEKRLSLWESLARRGSSIERVDWENQRVKFIYWDYASVSKSGQFVEPIPWQKIEPKYNKHGTLVELIVHWLKRPDQPSDFSETVYKKLDKNVTIQNLVNTAKDKLIQQIKEVASQVIVNEPVYCLAITWSPGQFQSLPPILGIGLDHERDKWIAEEKDNAKWLMWGPGNYSVFATDQLILRDKELLQVCELLNQEFGRRDKWNLGRKLLNEVAKSLNQFDWSNTFNTTADFVVFAAESELNDFTQNLRFSISSKLFNEFHEKDWLL